jgi:DNA repair protein RadC
MPLLLHETAAAQVASSPSNATAIELLATLIGGPRQVELAHSLMKRYDLCDLNTADTDDLAEIKGITWAMATRIKAAAHLGLRITCHVPARTEIQTSADAAKLFFPVFSNKDQEYMYVLLIDTRNRAICPPIEVYHGSLFAISIRVGELFKHAVKRNASSIVVAHNHPSGVPDPSPEDISTTKIIKRAGDLIDIALRDHLVFGGSRFVSLRERGYIK